jgi:hypothetical protein
MSRLACQGSDPVEYRLLNHVRSRGEGIEMINRPCKSEGEILIIDEYETRKIYIPPNSKARREKLRTDHWADASERAGGSSYYLCMRHYRERGTIQP